MLAARLGGEWLDAEVSDALGRPTTARYLVLRDGTAVIESAEAVGLAKLAPRERDPLVASSRGVGELILAALATRPTSLLVCVGGTATVDGGAGMRSVAEPFVHGVPIRVACDVRSPLLGDEGAARVFGPQKGADADAVELLEERLAALPELVPFRDLPGAGAGGGLGAGLAALGGELVSGADLVLDLIGFDDLARGADLVVTGEGTVDATTSPARRREPSSGAAPRSGFAASSSAASSATGSRRAGSAGRRDQAAEDVVELGEELALSLFGLA